MKYSRKFSFNPYIRILPSGRNIFIENMETKRKFISTWELLPLFKFCDKPRGETQILSQIKKLKLGQDDSKQYLQEMINGEILVDEYKLKSKSEILDQWGKYNWMMGAHFILESENQVFEDDENSSKQKEILKEYIKEGNLSFNKEYPNAEKIRLPKPLNIENDELDKVLLRRRTKRGYSGSITLNELSTLLYYGTAEMRDLRQKAEKKYKTDPRVLLNSIFSPFEIYIISNNIPGIKKGIYHYNVLTHNLERVRNGLFNRQMSLIAHGEMFLDNASFTVIVSAVFERYMFRYRYSKAYKELLSTCSQLAHYIILVATLMGIKTFETPALLDSRLIKLFKFKEGNEEGLYLLGFGK